MNALSNLDPETCRRRLATARDREAELERELYAARREVVLAAASVELAQHRPTWRTTFCPGVNFCQDRTYTLAHTSGYRYAIWNDHLYLVDDSVGHLVETGFVASSLD